LVQVWVFQRDCNSIKNGPGKVSILAGQRMKRWVDGKINGFHKEKMKGREWDKRG
jgi:hypothetical protein